MVCTFVMANMPGRMHWAMVWNHGAIRKDDAVHVRISGTNGAAKVFIAFLRGTFFVSTLFLCQDSMPVNFLDSYHRFYLLTFLTTPMWARCYYDSKVLSINCQPLAIIGNIEHNRLIDDEHLKSKTYDEVNTNLGIW